MWKPTGRRSKRCASNSPAAVEEGALIAPEGAEQAARALAAGGNALVWRRLVADTLTPVGAALRLIEPGRGDFLLESVEGGAVRGRYSLLGIDPDLVFRAVGAQAETNPRWQADRASFAPLEGDPLRALRALLAACRIEVPAGLPPALACVVGYFAYETLGLVEDIARPATAGIGLPDLLFVRPTVLLVFDSLGEELFCIAPIWGRPACGKAPDHQPGHSGHPPPPPSPHQAICAAGERIDAALARLSEHSPPKPVIPAICPTRRSLPSSTPNPIARWF